MKKMVSVIPSQLKLNKTQSESCCFCMELGFLYLLTLVLFLLVIELGVSYGRDDKFKNIFFLFWKNSKKLF